MKLAIALGMLLGTTLLLSACGGRDEPGGSFFDPLCMPDGSVVYRQIPDDNGQYGDAYKGSRDNCPWNKPAK